MGLVVTACFPEKTDPKTRRTAMLAFRSIAWHADASAFRNMIVGEPFVAVRDQPVEVAEKAAALLRRAGYSVQIEEIREPKAIDRVLPPRYRRLQWMLFGALTLMLAQLSFQLI